MFKSVLAILTVVAVLAAYALLKLPILPFRAIRDLIRHKAAPARLTT
ncbi:hypothetical protein ACRAWG_31160 [Methylobacterium sp. P31]